MQEGGRRHAETAAKRARHVAPLPRRLLRPCCSVARPPPRACWHACRPALRAHTRILTPKAQPQHSPALDHASLNKDPHVP